MNTWTPLFSKIVDSSVWAEPDHVRIVFVTMLAKKDADQVVRATAYMIGQWAKKTEAEALDALKILSSPDTKRIEPQPFEGRRIERVDGGWKILNGQVYENLMRSINRRAYKAEHERQRRQKRKGPDAAEVQYMKNVEAFGEEKADQMEADRQDAMKVKRDLLDRQASEVYECYPLKKKRPEAIRAIKKAIGEFGFALIISKTKEYAAVRNGDTSFMSNPSTFFNQEMFNDDPSTWRRNEKNTGTNQQRVDRNKGTLNEGRAGAYATKPNPT